MTKEQARAQLVERNEAVTPLRRAYRHALEHGLTDERLAVQFLLLIMNQQMRELSRVAGLDAPVIPEAFDSHV